MDNLYSSYSIEPMRKCDDFNLSFKLYIRRDDSTKDDVTNFPRKFMSASIAQMIRTQDSNAENHLTVIILQHSRIF